MDPLGEIDVFDAHRFDVEALKHYLVGRLGGRLSPMSVHEFRGGQSNPTYYIRTPAHEFVLRRKPPGPLLPTAHAIEREYRVMSALHNTGVPVPRTYL